MFMFLCFFFFHFDALEFETLAEEPIEAIRTTERKSTMATILSHAKSTSLIAESRVKDKVQLPSESLLEETLEEAFDHVVMSEAGFISMMLSSLGDAFDPQVNPNS
jgi:hypothetical protein